MSEWHVREMVQGRKGCVHIRRMPLLRHDYSSTVYVQHRSVLFSLVVSVKDRAVSLPDKQKCAKEEMIELFDRTDCPYGAGILLMHGCATGAETKEPLLVTTPKQHQFLFFEIAIPSDDPYGINALINNSVVEGGERAEVYSSHADIYLAGDTPVDTQLRSSKRTNAPEKDVPLQMLSQLRAIVDVTRRKRPLD